MEGSNDAQLPEHAVETHAPRSRASHALKVTDDSIVGQVGVLLVTLEEPDIENDDLGMRARRPESLRGVEVVLEGDIPCLLIVAFLVIVLPGLCIRAGASVSIRDLRNILFGILTLTVLDPLGLRTRAGSSHPVHSCISCIRCTGCII